MTRKAPEDASEGLEASSSTRRVRYALQRLQGTDADGDGLLFPELWTCRAAGICGSIEFTICPHARVVTSSKLAGGEYGGEGEKEEGKKKKVVASYLFFFSL